jgi:nucleoside-diphosphate-sugar epimerase
MTDRALVTGGGGFLGSYIVKHLLARGDTVAIFSRGAYPQLAHLGARVIRGDLRDAEAVQRACAEVDVVYHVAAKAGLWGDWDDFHSVNVTGTDNVIAACHHHGISRLIYTSSPSVVFDGTDQRGVDETYPYPARYESPYPATKAMAEQRVLASNGPELRTVSLRPHLIFGPGDNHLLPAMLARAKTGRVPQVGDGTNRVDLTYVEDAARAHLLAADALADDEATALGKAYFISQGEPVILWQWIGDLLAQLDMPPIRLKLGLTPARSAGAVMAGLYQALRIKRQPPLTPFLASELAQNHYYDISRAKQDLGYRPQYTMAEATAKTIAWLRQAKAIEKL